MILVMNKENVKQFEYLLRNLDRCSRVATFKRPRHRLSRGVFQLFCALECYCHCSEKFCLVYTPDSLSLFLADIFVGLDTTCSRLCFGVGKVMAVAFKLFSV
jgi:hypothetical protein